MSVVLPLLLALAAPPAPVVTVQVAGLASAEKTPRAVRRGETIDLSLGQQLDGLTIVVTAPQGTAVRVQRTVTTSISLSDEGPHRDLPGLADQVHPAQLAVALDESGRRFKIANPSDAEQKAGAYTRATIERELRRRKDTRWLTAYQEGGCCAQVIEAPSQARVDVQVYGDKGWTTALTFNLRLPMGC